MSQQIVQVARDAQPLLGHRGMARHLLALHAQQSRRAHRLHDGQRRGDRDPQCEQRLHDVARRHTVTRAAEDRHQRDGAHHEQYAAPWAGAQRRPRRCR